MKWQYTNIKLAYPQMLSKSCVSCMGPFDAIDSTSPYMYDNQSWQEKLRIDAFANVVIGDYANQNVCNDINNETILRLVITWNTRKLRALTRSPSASNSSLYASHATTWQLRYAICMTWFRREILIKPSCCSDTHWILSTWYCKWYKRLARQNRI